MHSTFWGVVWQSPIFRSLDTFEKYRDTPPISIAILLQKYALLLAESSIFDHQFVSRYASHLHRDTFAEVLGSGVVGTLPTNSNSVQGNGTSAKTTLLNNHPFANPQLEDSPQNFHETSHKGIRESARESVHSSGRSSLVLFSPVLFLNHSGPRNLTLAASKRPP